MRTLIAFLLGIGLGAWLGMRYRNYPAPVDCSPKPPALSEARRQRPAATAVVAPRARRSARPVSFAPTDSKRCPDNFTAYAARDLPFQLTCRCARGQWREGSVWGTEIYTTDSSLCAAAKHDRDVDEGEVTIHLQPGLVRYRGTTQNEVSSSSYPRWEKSFAFTSSPDLSVGVADSHCPYNAMGLGAPRVSCRCTREATEEGSVWGSGLYTADSSICRAARHAGYWRGDGDEVTVYLREGLAQYESTTAYGVPSLAYGSFASSFSFN